MRKIVSLAAIAALFVSILSGCAAQNGGMREHQGAAIGAGTGAVGGAVVGGLLGGRRGAVAGGLLGALAGGLVGNYHDQREKNLAETRRAYTEYNAAKGTRLKIERVRTNPHDGRPGRHRGDPADLRRPHPAGRRDGPRTGEPRDPLQRRQGGGGLRSTSSAREAPGAPSSPSRSPGTPVRGTTASSPRWSRAEGARISRRSRSACIGNAAPGAGHRGGPFSFRFRYN